MAMESRARTGRRRQPAGHGARGRGRDYRCVRRAAVGFGLGLAIVKQLVLDIGGTVALDEAPSGGVAVRIALRAVTRFSP
ncbi:hypothetical protein C1I99_26485 [Micromonospora deserti]|uniref:Histidine kinase/HSP90-like ATPase domain-containing protein n=1 Tax=Micromonospora deserti TaxID=2070366 RepID=A0A2W2CJ54_9ACTN|nr:hypothetical protein C1I99_26485 [Micromonospora deserti]